MGGIHLQLVETGNVQQNLQTCSNLIIFWETQKFSFIRYILLLIGMWKWVHCRESLYVMKCCRASLTIGEQSSNMLLLTLPSSRMLHWCCNIESQLPLSFSRVHYTCSTNIIKPAFNACTVTNTSYTVGHPSTIIPETVINLDLLLSYYYSMLYYINLCSFYTTIITIYELVLRLYNNI